MLSEQNKEATPAPQEKHTRNGNLLRMQQPLAPMVCITGIVLHECQCR